MPVNSKSITLTDRDEAILTDLYFTRILSTEQIRSMYFNAYNTAKSRLHEIKNMQWIVPWSPKSGLTIWTLGRKAFEREVENLHREGERYKGWPKKEAVPHIVDANDVYVGMKQDLDSILGKYPAWEWKDESRSWWSRDKAGKRKGINRPDAEITLLSNRYFLERQTSRARTTYEAIEGKIIGYRRYINRLEDNGTEVEVLFACDTERDMDYAEEAAQEHQVAMTAGTPEQIIEYLLDKAREAKPEAVRA